MSECPLVRCQQDRKLIRREFNKWTKNILLQIGLETISKNHFDYDIKSFNQANEQIPIDFNSDEMCLFCINRQEYLSKKKLTQNKTQLWLNEDTDPIIADDENSPLDLSVKSTPDLHSQSLFDIKSDILPLYNPEELLLSSQMNFDYLSQSFPHMNLFSILSMNQYQLNSSVQDNHINQLAKQMAYSRMIQEIEYQQNNNKSEVTTNYLNTSSILTESMHVNHILNDIMMRTLNEIYEQQIKEQQQTRVSRQGELLFVKKQNNNNDDITVFNTKKQHQHSNQINPSSSSSSSASSASSKCSSSIHTKMKNKSKSNQSSTRTSNRKASEMILNSKVMVGMDGKQIRPKRGQYRRYEYEQLAKAVVAVLSNKMSVHKAGSYFGVPHSTLEYKVKERNAKMSTTTKDKNDLSPSILVDGNIAVTKSMKYDDGDDDNELQSYIPIELDIN